MPKKKQTRRTIADIESDLNAFKDLFFRRILETDARLIALQAEVSYILNHNEEQREAFDAAIEERFNDLYRIFVEAAAAFDPELSARLLAEIDGKKSK